MELLFAVFLVVSGSQGEIIKTDQFFNDRFTYRLQTKRLLWLTLNLETALLETEVSILVKLRFRGNFRSWLFSVNLRTAYVFQRV